MGYGGVNVIDSSDERIAMFCRHPDPIAAASSYFQTMRTRLARLSGQTAMHIQKTPIRKDIKYILDGKQDGVIELRYDTRHGQPIRLVRVESLRGAPHDQTWHEFVIGPTGVTIFAK